MINIKNTQRKINLDIKKIYREVEQILEILKYKDFDIGIWFTTDKTIHEYNKTYRHKDKPTDVLSFPYHTELRAGERIVVNSPEDANIGDLIISPSYVLKDAEKLGVAFETRLQLIIVHGICHLLGYDHIEDKDFRIMRAKEVSIIKKLNSG